MEDDLQSIRRLKNGDIGGLETLVSRYQVKAIRAAYLILNNTQAAEDVAQDTFLHIFKHIHNFDESRPFGPYLYRSVMNAALDAAQRDLRQEQIAGDLKSLETLLYHSLSVEGTAEFNTLKQDIRAALENLSPRQRTAVVMRYYLEMSEKEMSEVLQIRPGTVKWYLNTARERLRILLGERNVR